MDIKHIVIYKGTDHHSAFPEVIRLQNGELLTVFRQAPVRAGTGVHRERNAKVTHFHQDTSSRAALVRSLDDGDTWDPTSFVIVPLIVGGKAQGQVKQGRFIRCKSGTLNSNMWLSIAKLMGLEIDSFADSTGLVSDMWT